MNNGILGVTSLRKPTTPIIFGLGLLGAVLTLGMMSAWSQNPPSQNVPPQPNPENEHLSDQPHPTPELSSSTKYEGAIVHDIQFHGIAGTNADMLRGLVLVKAGEPLDREALRESIRVLYSTGRFSSLRVEASPATGGGISLTFVATENYFNGAVDIQGLSLRTPPKAHQLIYAARLDLGELFAEDNLKVAMERMNKVMGDNGYHQSSITYDLRPNEDTRQMDMVFHVTPGDVARVGTVKIEGDAGISEDQVVQITRLRSGNKVRNADVTRALDRLRRHYQRNQHLEAQVSLTGREYQAASNTVDYVFEVEQGSRVVITAEGTNISNRDMRRLVPVYQENAVDDDLLNEGRRNLRNFMQTRGYFDVSVDVERRPVP